MKFRIHHQSGSTDITASSQKAASARFVKLYRNQTGKDPLITKIEGWHLHGVWNALWVHDHAVRKVL